MVVFKFPDDSPNERQQHFSHKECPRNVQGMVTHQSTMTTTHMDKKRKNRTIGSSFFNSAQSKVHV